MPQRPTPASLREQDVRNVDELIEHARICAERHGCKEPHKVNASAGVFLGHALAQHVVTIALGDHEEATEICAMYVEQVKAMVQQLCIAKRAG